MAEKKKKNVRHTTPAGLASWPKLHTPDTKFNVDGTFGVKLLLDANLPEHQAFLEKLDTMAAAALVEMKSENSKYAKVMKLVTPYAPELDKEGEETGKTVVNFTMPAIIRNKEKTKEWNIKPALFDAKGTPLAADIEIGGGSTIKVSFESWAYFNAKDKEAGIVRRLVAVQVLDLKTWNGNQDASAFGFGEEEGFSPAADAIEAASPASADF